ncbi:terminase family protein [Ruegeria sp. HKCCE4148]|uniref:terminase large subunit domain-containing protein n=1 Tax=Ruegeria sp. HKCCE4148 TaxID=2794829 RepID=UPI001AE4B790|nr:terminase family protein [Ruegeria sp. HKCCE4148]
MNLELDIDLRPEQEALYDARTRFTVRVCHRRMGKTWVAIVELLVLALTTKRNDWRGIYVAPSYVQAKSVAWDYLKAFTSEIPGTKINEAELRIDLYNGARIRLLGAERYDSLRGQYADHAVLDEAQLIPTAAYTQVIRPMLADRQGSLVVQGTPAGRMNLLFELLQQAKTGDDPAWSGVVVPVTDTDILHPTEIEAMKREMSEAEYEQELLCSFNAAIRGAYLSKEMRIADEQNRITQVKYDPAADVTVALDLGWSDLMVCVFVQQVGTEHHFLGVKAYAETNIADMIRDWGKLPFEIDNVILPHDAKQHEMISGQTREDVFRSMMKGKPVRIANRVREKHEGIEQVRMLLPHCWFDQTECHILVEALNAYRAEYDEVRRVSKVTPVHDWSSHYFDAVQTYALGRIQRQTSPDRLHWPGQGRATPQPDNYGYRRGA